MRKPRTTDCRVTSASSEQELLISNPSVLPATDFQDAMATWTLQMGFPLVSMKRNSDGMVEVTQQRFLIDQTADPLTPESPYK